VTSQSRLGQATHHNSTRSGNRSRIAADTSTLVSITTFTAAPIVVDLFDDILVGNRLGLRQALDVLEKCAPAFYFTGLEALIDDQYLD
jgi:hypothetical protein